MKKTTLLIGAFVFALFYANAQPDKKTVGIYTAVLTKVDLPNKYSADMGSLNMVESSYSDKYISIIWAFGEKQLEFTLKNNTGNTIKVIWDDAAIITPQGDAKRVFHKGVKFTDKANSQPPTSIFKGTNISDLIAPSEFASFSSSMGGWTQRPLIPAQYNMWKKGNIYDPRLVGLIFKAVLPIKINETETIEYSFEFMSKFIKRK